MNIHEDIEMENHYMGDDERDTQEHLEKNSNVRELEQLREEIDSIMANGISPPEAWYQKRYINIQIYSELGWSHMAQRFDRIDRYIHNTAMNIMNNIEDLLEGFHRKGHFQLRYYQHLIHDIETLWNYYKTTYIGNESDPDVGDLIVGLTHMLSNL
jgi:hypothetical protein